MPSDKSLALLSSVRQAIFAFVATSLDLFAHPERRFTHALVIGVSRNNSKQVDQYYDLASSLVVTLEELARIEFLASAVEGCKDWDRQMVAKGAVGAALVLLYEDGDVSTSKPLAEALMTVSFAFYIQNLANLSPGQSHANSFNPIALWAESLAVFDLKDLPRTNLLQLTWDKSFRNAIKGGEFLPQFVAAEPIPKSFYK